MRKVHQKLLQRLLKDTEVLGRWRLHQGGHGEVMQGGGLGTLHKNLLQVNQEEILVLQTLSTRRFPLQCWVLPGVTVFLLGSSRCRHSPAAVWAEQRAVISTGGSGEMGGTVHSVEMKRSLVRSGTGKTPERCFGNSGENWSADNLTA